MPSSSSACAPQHAVSAAASHFAGAASAASLPVPQAKRARKAAPEEAAQREAAREAAQAAVRGMSEARKKEIKASLQRVHGIGPATADTLLHRHGITSLAMLAERPDLMDDAMRIGLKYMHDLEIRISRAEVTALGALVAAAARRIDPAIVTEICGSYRRGKLECGDIDVLIYHPDIGVADPREPVADASSAGAQLLSLIIQQLRGEGVIVASLAQGPTKFMGVARLPGGGCAVARAGCVGPPSSSGAAAACSGGGGVVDLTGDEAFSVTAAPSSAAPSVHRRIDVRFIPQNCWPFALLYFTGSGEFNAACRGRGALLQHVAPSPLTVSLGCPVAHSP